MRAATHDDPSEPFIDLFASMLFIAVLALLAAMLRNERAAERVKTASEMMASQVSLRSELGRDLSDVLGHLVYVDRESA